MKPPVAKLATSILLFLLFSLGVASGGLKVDESGRFLVEEDKPFFYLADTAWELLHRLSKAEAETYLKHRARAGFNVVHVAIIPELNGLNAPNAEGLLPLRDNDPSQPDRRYFRRLDELLDYAEAQGLHLGLVPAWGDKWNRRWGMGPEIFNENNARGFGEFLGSRYEGRKVIWILGGDRNPENPEHHAVIQAMAEGLRKGHRGRNLMTFFPMAGDSSSRWFHENDWLDLNMVHSGQRRRAITNYDLIAADLARTAKKPVLDGGSSLEDHPIAWNKQNGSFNDTDVRRQAWWAVLSGACGHIYGNHNLWQMWTPARESVLGANIPWVEALEQPGGSQMKHLKKIYSQTGWLKAAQDLIKSPNPEGVNHFRCGASQAMNLAVVYLPEGGKVKMDLSAMKGNRCDIWQLNPRTGVKTDPIEYSDLKNINLSSPKVGPGEDWVFLIQTKLEGVKESSAKKEDEGKTSVKPAPGSSESKAP